MIRLVLGAIFVLLSAPGVGAVYKCKGADGATTFSDKPCSANAEVVDVPNGGPKPMAFGPDPTWCDEGAAPQELVDACLEAWRPGLRDPRSAYAQGGRLARNQKNGDLDVFVNGYAKNGFGGMNDMEMWCKRTADNVVDATGTSLHLRGYAAEQALGMKHERHTLLDCSNAPSPKP